MKIKMGDHNIKQYLEMEVETPGNNCPNMTQTRDTFTGTGQLST